MKATILFHRKIQNISFILYIFILLILDLLFYMVYIIIRKTTDFNDVLGSH